MREIVFPYSADPNHFSAVPAISADGRFVTYLSPASNLFPDDDCCSEDLVLHDRLTGNNKRIGPGGALNPAALSADGRFVAFDNGTAVFVYSRENAVTETVSVGPDGTQANGPSSNPAVSGDGNLVAFQSSANNLVAGDSNNQVDVFVLDRATGVVERVSVDSAGNQANGSSSDAALSANGRMVVFASDADNLTATAGNGGSSIFLHNRALGTTELVAPGAEPDVNENGQLVVFVSDAEALFPEQIERRSSVFVYDRESRSFELIAPGNKPSISADGRYVALVSEAPDLVVGDSNELPDVFLHDRETQTITRVSVASDGSQSSGFVFEAPAVSADAGSVVFMSGANDLVAGDSNDFPDIFAHQRETAITERISVASLVADVSPPGVMSAPAVNGEGRLLAFHSDLANLVGDDDNRLEDVFLYDTETETYELLSIADDGNLGDGASGHPAISRDGSVVAFVSAAANLVPEDNNAVSDVFVRDRTRGRSVQISVDSAGVPGDQASGTLDCCGESPAGAAPALSADGRVVAFVSDATNLVPDDTNGVTDVFVRDRDSGTTTRVSVDSSGIQGNAASGNRFGSAGPGLSADGRFVVFESTATNLAPGAAPASNIYIHDRDTGSTGLAGADSVSNPAISGDGRFVAFWASGCLPVDEGSINFHLCVYDHETGVIERVASRFWNSARVAISEDGRFVASREVTPGDGAHYIALHDRLTGLTTFDASDLSGNDRRWFDGGPALSADGRVLVYQGDASNAILSGSPPNTFLHSRTLFIYVAQPVVDDDNRPPVANPGPELTLECNGSSTEVTLDASRSADPDGDPLGFRWSGSFGSIIESESLTVGVDLDVGVHHVELTVTDPGGLSDTASTVVTVQDSAGPEIDLGLPVQLAPTSAAGAPFVLEPLIADLCSPVTSVVREPDLQVYPLGTTTVSVTATDRAGNSASVETTVTVAEGDGSGDDTEQLPIELVDADLMHEPLNPVLNGDGSRVAFESASAILVYDRRSNMVQPVSVDPTGAPANDVSQRPAISADGNVVVFLSAASNLVVGDSNGQPDVFIHDLESGKTRLASVDVNGNLGAEPSWDPAVSADGNTISFVTASVLVSGDTNGERDVFLVDRVSGRLDRASIDPNGNPANNASETPALSADGNVVAFASFATNLVPGDDNGWLDVFVRERTTGITELVSVDSAGNQADSFSTQPAISADGRFVAFVSTAGNLASGANNDRFKVFVRDRLTSSTTLASTNANGLPFSVSHIFHADIDADGTLVAFRTWSDQTSRSRVFLRDLRDQGSRLIGIHQSGISVSPAYDPAISADGRVVAFQDDARDAPRVGTQTLSFISLDTGIGTEPSARMTVTPLNGAPLTLQFNGDLSNADRGISIYRFDFDDGNGTFSELATVQHTYTEPGVYDVVLKVIDADGVFDVARLSVAVAHSGRSTAGAPVSSFTAVPVKGAAPLTVRFDGGAASDDQGIVIYRYDFGDYSGTYDDRSVVEHTYQEPGQYHAVLKVIDADGNADFARVPIMVDPSR